MDNIKQKLAAIDRQLTGVSYHEQIISTSPLLFAAAGLIAGILIQNSIQVSLSIWLVLLALFTAISLILYLTLRSSTYCRYSLAYTALACFICLGAIRLNGFTQPDKNDIRNFIKDEPVLATIRGTIISKPAINQYNDWKFSEFVPTDPYSSFYLNLREIETAEGWVKAKGKVRVYVDEPVLDLASSDYIQAHCWLRRFEHATNPGQFDTADYLARRNVFINASVTSRNGIELIPQSKKSYFSMLKNKFIQIATNALTADLPQEDINSGLLQALLIGERKEIDKNTYDAFRRTGLLHFLSLSGLHMGILIGIVWWLSKIAGLMKPARAVVCIIAIAIFLMIVPPRAPTLRAAIICFIFCLTFFFRRRPNPFNSLSLAAIILLLIRPTQLFEPGWQLSFAAVLGILIFTEKTTDFLNQLNNYILSKIYPDNTSGISNFWISKFTRYVITLFSVGLAAWLGGAGILLYHFYTINPLSSLWTTVVFPFVALILILGFFKIILFFLLPSLSVFLGLITIQLSNLLVWIVKMIDGLNISQIIIGDTSFNLVLFYYCTILFAGLVYMRGYYLKKIIVVTTICVILFSLSYTKWHKIHREDFILTVLDVGHGQAILAQLPERENILFDAGSMYNADIGSRIVNPFLNYAGISNINSIIISHNDIDHINGIPEIVESIKVKNVYANDDFFRKTETSQTAFFLQECLNQSGTKIESLENNLDLNSRIDMKILWPLKDSDYDQQLSDNDRSLVILMEFVGRKILLCSDIEQFAQKELMKLYPELNADIVIVPHHGSDNTLEPGFLESLNAELLICSCSQNQYNNSTLFEQIESRNSEKPKQFNTASNGAIFIRIGNNGDISVGNF